MAITPVAVCPGHLQVIALPYEYSMLQDGYDKQACERVVGKWYYSVPLLNS